MDQQYWNDFYQQSTLTKEPSPFALEMKRKYVESGKLLELGCGNGRYSLFFAKNQMKVTAIDESKTAIAQLAQQHPDTGIHFVVGDFISNPEIWSCTYPYIYSRFTMHAISDEQQKLLLEKLRGSLDPNGIFMAEMRSVRDDLYGKGTQVGRNAFVYQEHYRRFLAQEEFLEALQSGGCTVWRRRSCFAPCCCEEHTII